VEQFVTRILAMAVFLIVAESIGTLLGIDANTGFQITKLVIFCSLLGSAVLALFRPVDTWGDGGFVLGVLWGGAGILVALWLLGPGVWAIPTGLGADAVQRMLLQGDSFFPGSLFGRLAGQLVWDTGITALGMAIVAVPVVAIQALLHLVRQR